MYFLCFISIAVLHLWMFKNFETTCLSYWPPQKHCVEIILHEFRNSPHFWYLQDM